MRSHSQSPQGRDLCVTSPQNTPAHRPVFLYKGITKTDLCRANQRPRGSSPPPPPPSPHPPHPSAWAESSTAGQQCTPNASARVITRPKLQAGLKRAVAMARSGGSSSCELIGPNLSCGARRGCDRCGKENWARPFLSTSPGRVSPGQRTPLTRR